MLFRGTQLKYSLRVSAPLDHPQIWKQIHRFTVDDYHCCAAAGLLSSGVELLRGIIFTRETKSPLHEFIAQWLTKELWPKLPPGFELRRESPLSLSDSEPEPDISIVQGAPEQWLHKHPSTAHLVIEISISTVDIDQEKGAIYAEAGIPEYWIIRPAERIVDVCSRPARSGYAAKRMVHHSEILQSISVPALSVNLADIFPK